MHDNRLHSLIKLSAPFEKVTAVLIQRFQTKPNNFVNMKLKSINKVSNKDVKQIVKRLSHVIGNT